eukprot:281621-Amphidinium_carterae.1
MHCPAAHNLHIVCSVDGDCTLEAVMDAVVIRPAILAPIARDVEVNWVPTPQDKVHYGTGDCAQYQIGFRKPSLHLATLL